MSTRKIHFVPGEFYHVYNRGVDKRVIFDNHHDYMKFMGLLYVCNSHQPLNSRELQKNRTPLFDLERGETLVSIGAYCLMPNHFHLLVTPKTETSLSEFLRKVCTSYSMFFNVSRERSGALFQGKFKSEWVSDDVYLKYLFSYIHLNPVKLLQHDWKEKGIQNHHKTLEYLKQYAYSSFFDYDQVVREESKILDRDVFPKYFIEQKDFDKEIFEWVTHKPGV